MNRQSWEAAFATLPPNLTLAQVSWRLNKPYRLTAAWAKTLNYPHPSGHSNRPRRRLIDWTRVPWHCSNSQIARAFGLSREIVRRRRNELGKPKPNRTRLLKTSLCS